MANSPASRYLRRAAELAERGLFRVEPNPCVGCVIVKRGGVVGEGYHRYWGGPHAEIDALRDAGKDARGATAYVTLEPCGHRGKRPPCAAALVRAGVEEVVYAHADRSVDTAGLGAAMLREAGIGVRRARTPRRIAQQLRPYLEHLQRCRPWVIAKWAMTLDGRIATRTGDSKWISSERSRRWAHKNLRARADAIIVGAGTVLTDNPALSNRSGSGGRPLRVVVCGRRPLRVRSRVLTDGGPTLLAVPAQYRAPKGTDVLVAGRAWRVDLRELLRRLHERGVHRVLVEGGGEILGSFFDAGLVDQAAVFVAPRVVGGVTAAQPVGGKGRAVMSGAFRLDRARETKLGPDRLFEGYVR